MIMYFIEQFESFPHLSNNSFQEEVFNENVAVAARLRSLRSDDPSSKGHPRSMKQESET